MTTTVSVAAGHWLAVPAAESYARARAAGLPPGITSAGRTHEQQVVLFTARYRVQWTGRGPYNDVRWWRGRRYVRHSAAGSVAVPGSASSRHELGLSLDLPMGGPREWMHANGLAYGWVPWIAPGEPWHFEYQDTRDRHHGEPTPTPPPDPPAADPEEYDMVIIRKTSTGECRLLAGLRTSTILDVADLAAFEAAGVKRVELRDKTFDRLVSDSSR